MKCEAARFSTGERQVIRAYWQQVLRIISGIEQVSAAKDFATDVQHDIDILQISVHPWKPEETTPRPNRNWTWFAPSRRSQVVLGQTKKRAKELPMHDLPGSFP